MTHETVSGLRPARPGARRGTLAAALLAALLLATGAAAQDARHAEVRGRVVDASSGKPVAGAVVTAEREGRSAVASADGTFTLARLPAGTLELGIRALGYGAGTHSLNLDAGAVSEVTLSLTPDPVLLQGLEVVADRFEDRRTAYPRNVQVLASRELATSTHRDVAQLLRARVGLRASACAGGRLSGLEQCLVQRGRPVPMLVYVDEVRTPGGLAVLELYRPNDVEMLEVYGNGREIHLYTASFLEWAARNRYLPQPIGI